MHGHEAHQQHAHSAAVHPEAKSGAKANLRTPLGIFFLAMVIAIIILTVYFRIPMLKFFGFYEPDGFYHYSVIRDAINHGFSIQPYLSISGYPAPTKVTEPYGLYWVTMVPYAFLQYFGVSYYTVERLIPLLFGVLDVLGAYLLSRYISKDKLFGLLVMVFVALSGGDEARTSALIYRGDGFIVIFLLLALVFMLETFRQHDRNKKLLYALLIGFSLSLGSLVFSGAAFAMGVYALSLIIILAFGFIFARDSLVDNLKYGLLGLFIWWIITSIYLGLGWIQQQIFVGTQFLYLFVPLMIGWLLAYVLTIRPDVISGIFDARRYLNTAAKRIAMLAIVVVIFVTLFIIFESAFLYNIFVNNGFITSGNSNVAATKGSVFQSTIQELQPPTPGFLFASFTINIYTTPPSLILLLSSYVGQDLTILFLFLVVTFVPYLFMQIYDSGKFMSGRPRFLFDINLGVLVILAYFAVTAYLQIHAIRFNSLISVPLAILSAYTIYWLISYARFNSGKNIIPGFVAASIFSFVIMLGIGIQLTTILPASIPTPAVYLAVAGIFALAIGIIVLLKYLYDKSKRMALSVALIILSILYAIVQIPSFGQYPTIGVASVLMVFSLIAIAYAEMRFNVSIWYAFGIVFFVYILIYYNAIYTAGLVQADSLDPAFFTALQWFGANSPQNASVLTLWPDGSVVEGVSNRTAVMDSVGSQNASKADPFAAWLLNASDDPQFLTGRYMDRPSYFLVRNTWMSETGGIFTEASVTNNNLIISNYSYVQFTSFTENSNSSQLTLQFTSPPAQGVELAAYVDVLRNATQGSGLKSSIDLYNSTTGRSIGQLSLSRVTFYNDSNSAFSQVPVSNDTSGYTLLLNYSPVPRPQATINITGAYAVAPALANSNMFKFLYLCNTAACEWNNNVASMQLIYQNSDTKIFKIDYNSSA